MPIGGLVVVVVDVDVVVVVAATVVTADEAGESVSAVASRELPPEQATAHTALDASSIA
jgi:hypothetical protein